MAVKGGKDACGLCGKDPSAGFATVNDVRYCHGDFAPEPTCYMKAQRIPLQAAALTAHCTEDSANEPPDFDVPGDDFGG